MDQKDWVTVREHLEALFREQWKGHEAYHAATETAYRQEQKMLAGNLDKALDVLKERFENHNQWRQQLTSERVTLVQRATCEANVKTVDERLGRLENAQANLSGRLTTVAGALAVGLVALELVLKFVFGK